VILDSSGPEARLLTAFLHGVEIDRCPCLQAGTVCNTSASGLCSRALIESANAEFGEADVSRMRGGDSWDQDRNSLGRTWTVAGTPELSVSDATSPIRSRLPRVSILNCHVTNAPSSDDTIRL
jgi:hypothetical protein